MTNSYLKKIILEEIKNVLNENVAMYKGFNKLTPEQQAQAKRLEDGGTPPDAAIKIAGDTTPQGQKSIDAALAENPIGRLQTYLIKLGKKVSDLPGNRPDSRIGPLTIQAIKEVTGKTYTPQYVVKNIKGINTEIAKAVAAKSGIAPTLPKAAADAEKLNVDIPQQKGATSSKQPKGSTTSPPVKDTKLAPGEMGYHADIPTIEKTAAELKKTTQPEIDPALQALNQQKPPMFNVDPSKAPPASKSPLDGGIEDLGAVRPTKVKESLKRDLARMLKNL